MTDNSLNAKIKTAIKWSAITEISAKIVMPISSMILARLLDPEAFGVVVTLTMLISFAEIFSDAGFQKYLIQHNFSDDEGRMQSTNVAFWTNFIISLLIWAIIIFFRNPIAEIVGSPGLGYVLAIASISIPLASFSSIQMALYKRDFDFNTLFKSRIIGVLIPIVVTVPLALVLKNFWALVIGTIARDVVNVLILTYYSKWVPRFFYSFSKLKEMFTFTMWTLIESLSIWAASYLDIFIVGKYLDAYYLGIYRTSMITVVQISSLITSAVTPIVFSSLSRVQDNKEEFQNMFFTFQKFVGMIILPLGLGFYFYSDLLTDVLLGNQWEEAADFVGLYGFSLCVLVVFSYLCSEAYRALGKPKLSLWVQLLYISFFIPALLWAVTIDFKTLYVVRSLSCFVMVAINLTVMYFAERISPIRMVKELFPAIICTIIMSIWSVLSTSYNNNFLWTVISIAISIIFYFVALTFLFPKEKTLLLQFAKRRKKYAI